MAAEPARTAAWSWVTDGLVAGLIASAAHWVAYHAMTALAEGEPLEPSRYMASVILGRNAFDPEEVEYSFGALRQVRLHHALHGAIDGLPRPMGAAARG